MLGTVCVYAQPPRNEMSQEDTGRTASSSSSFLKKEPMVLRELVRFWPSIWPHGELLFLLDQKAGICARQRVLQLFRWGWLIVPELKGGGEASEDDHADNVINEALYVIGLHGSGDTISRFLQDWEVTKVARSLCHIALDLLCQELYEVERRRGWFGFWTRMSVERQAPVS